MAAKDLPILIHLILQWVGLQAEEISGEEGEGKEEWKVVLDGDRITAEVTPLSSRIMVQIKHFRTTMGKQVI
jgi:hypothetical protein